MRLWLPEKASARLSIKGFVGAGCIFPRHRGWCLTSAPVLHTTVGLYIWSKVLHIARVNVTYSRDKSEGDTWTFDKVCIFACLTNFSLLFSLSSLSTRYLLTHTILIKKFPNLSTIFVQNSRQGNYFKDFLVQFSKINFFIFPNFFYSYEKN